MTNGHRENTLSVYNSQTLMLFCINLTYLKIYLSVFLCFFSDYLEKIDENHDIIGSPSAEKKNASTENKMSLDESVQKTNSSAKEGHDSEKNVFMHQENSGEKQSMKKVSKEQCQDTNKASSDETKEDKLVEGIKRATGSICKSEEKSLQVAESNLTRPGEKRLGHM